MSRTAAYPQRGQAVRDRRTFAPFGPSVPESLFCRRCGQPRTAITYRIPGNPKPKKR